ASSPLYSCFVRPGLCLSTRGCRGVRYVYRLVARLAPPTLKTNGLAADGERRGGESAPKARGMECPAPLLRRIAARRNAAAPARRGKPAMAPPPRGRPCSETLACRGQCLAQCRRAVSDGATRGRDQPAVTDKAVVDAFINGKFARHPRLFEPVG